MIIAWLRRIFGSRTEQSPVSTPTTSVKSKPTTPPSIAFVRPQRAVSRVFVHCSASDDPNHDDIAVIRKWHVEGNGWNDVGYHYFIRKDGTLQPGRPLERVPAAQQGHNTGTIAICLHGLEKDKFTPAQFDMLRALCRAIGKAYNNSVTFHGHCEVNPHKTCPVFDYKGVLNLGPKGRMILT